MERCCRQGERSTWMRCSLNLELQGLARLYRLSFPKSTDSIITGNISSQPLMLARSNQDNTSVSSYVERYGEYPNAGHKRSQGQINYSTVFSFDQNSAARQLSESNGSAVTQFIGSYSCSEDHLMLQKKRLREYLWLSVRIYIYSSSGSILIPCALADLLCTCPFPE